MTKSHISEQQKIRAVTLYAEESLSYERVGELYGVSGSTVREWCKRYEQEGRLERKQNPEAGMQSKINEHCSQVIKILKNPAVRYGYETDFWTTQRVQQVLKKELRLKVSRMAVWRFLKSFEFSYRKPESRFYHKNKEKNSELWIKKTIPKIKRLVKKHNAILYFEDESSISLTPSLAKTWAPKNTKLTRTVSPNIGSVSAISAISDSGYLIFNVHDGNKRFNSQDIIIFLGQMLKHHTRRHLVVVMDQAPCHTSKAVKEYVESQKRLHVFYLPPRSPEFNPDEQVWDYLKNKKLKEHKATTTKELKKLAKKKLLAISKDQELIKGIFHLSEGATFFS